VRTPGKLPYEKIEQAYGLEYGRDVVQAHVDSVSKGEKVLIVDDLLATGGTARALAELTEKLGTHVVGCAFLVELAFLGGRERLAGFDVHALVSYEAE
jgi:adenine phosphoribosyltransferase